MKIDTKKLNGVEKNKILSHLLLADKTVAELVSKTLSEECRDVEVKVIFNGVECNGQILEDVLQDAWKNYKQSVDEKYADFEKLAQEKALKIAKKFIEDRRHEALTKLENIQDRLNKVDVELWCIDVYEDDLEKEDW